VPRKQKGHPCGWPFFAYRNSRLRGYERLEVFLDLGLRLGVADRRVVDPAGAGRDLAGRDVVRPGGLVAGLHVVHRRRGDDPRAKLATAATEELRAEG